MTAKKKLIEVALPLEAINKASAREKSIRHGHLSTLCLWSARRPLAAARAVIFAQMVDDPSAHPDIFSTEKKQEKERQRLFRIIEEPVKWENTTNETVLQQARDEIWQSWRYTYVENADHPRAKNCSTATSCLAFTTPLPVVVLVAKLGSQAETARELCYRLYTLCERKKRATEAMAYLVQRWPEITRLAREASTPVKPDTDDLFDDGGQS
jgi:adenine-specific DNA methylase